MSEELTEDQISQLPEELRPGYTGEDEAGRYKVDNFGIKKRPFEKGGPSPSPGRNSSRQDKADDLMADRNWMGPLEFYMAVMNCDHKIINKTRARLGKDYYIKPTEITFRDQLEAASKVLPYQATKSSATKDKDEESSKDKPEEEGKAKLVIKGKSRKDLI